jgi:hypothetical protein
MQDANRIGSIVAADLPACEELPSSPDSFVQAYLADPAAWHWPTNLLYQSSEKILKRALPLLPKPIYRIRSLFEPVVLPRACIFGMTPMCLGRAGL